ncbi:MAG: hypothetical protein K0S38_543 [Candidatus Paceibacter sp.]|nr:hypothetical protein [Candidatus Paceibacter sp.]
MEAVVDILYRLAPSADDGTNLVKESFLFHDGKLELKPIAEMVREGDVFKIKGNRPTLTGYTGVTVGLLLMAVREVLEHSSKETAQAV